MVVYPRTMEERHKITWRSITKPMPGKKHNQEDKMDVISKDCSRPTKRSKHLVTR